MNSSKSDVTRGMIRAVVATAVYGGIHSGLASETAKSLAERAVGTRLRNAFYRPAFNLVAAITTGAWLAYVARQPDRPLYRVRGIASLVMRLGQLGSLACLVWTALSQDTLGFLGLPSAWAYFTGKPVIPPEPAAQGPSVDAQGRVQAAGPFARFRQPANVLFIPLLWLNPKMSAKWAAFNAAVSAYVILGSFHAEQLLRDAYGNEYAEYQKRVPMLAPLPGSSAK